MKEIVVIKRNGARELFDPEKIARVVQAAGLRPIDASELAGRIDRWAKNKDTNEITSIEIRDRVFKEIEKVDKYASGLFAWYQNMKDQKYASQTPKE